MGRFETAGGHLVFVAPVYRFDKRPVPFGGVVKMRTEGAVDKWVDHIAKGKKKLEVESFQQQRENILRSNALEALNEQSQL